MCDADFSPLWEKAYFRQHADAAVGRLFRGLLHNLNGIVQALSMQSELFAMTFPQLAELLTEGAVGPETDLPQRVDRVRATLESRARLSEQMQEKVQEAQSLLHRTALLSVLAEGFSDYTLATLIRTEVEFRKADMFFKHQVAKKLELAEDLPAVRRLGPELHQAIFALLANATEALREGIDNPRIRIEARQEGNSLHIGVEDNGPGIAPADLSRIFDPFFSTKEGHDGLGLYLVKKVMAGGSGQVHCTSHPGSTRFELVIEKENI